MTLNFVPKLSLSYLPLTCRKSEFGELLCKFAQEINSTQLSTVFDAERS